MHLCCTYIDMQNTALVLVRKSERQAQYVFEGECKSSDAECSAAPKMRFCENTEPHLFVIFWKLRPFAQNGRPGLVPSLPAAFDKMQAGGRTANG